MVQYRPHGEFCLQGSCGVTLAGVNDRRVSNSHGANSPSRRTRGSSAASGRPSGTQPPARQVFGVATEQDHVGRQRQQLGLFVAFDHAHTRGGLMAAMERGRWRQQPLGALLLELLD